MGANKGHVFFRKKIWIPFLLILGGILSYFTFFIDTHLKWGLEKGLTMANGAEVNVKSIKTSLKDGKLTISQIALTDTISPKHNRLELGKLTFRFNWDALLRAKFVVEEAGIENILLGGERKRPGKVLPPPRTPSQPKQETGQASFLKEQIEILKKDLKDNSLDQVESFFNKEKKVKELKEFRPENLKAIAKIKELRNDLNTKKDEWNSLLKKIPSSKELRQEKDKIRSFNIKNINLQNAASEINRAKELANSLKKRVEEIKKDAENLASGVNNFKDNFKSIDELIKEDKKTLQDLVKIPKLDFKDMAKDFFGKVILNKIAFLLPYLKYIEPYLKKKKNKEVPQAPKKAFFTRMKGVAIHFPKEKAYPLFWAKKLRISSKESEHPFSGNLNGEITHLSTNQKLSLRPTLFNLKGDFRKKSLNGISLYFKYDQLAEKVKKEGHFAIQSFPISDQALSKSEKLSLFLNSAKGKTKVEGSLIEDYIDLKWTTDLKDPNLTIDSKTKLLKSLLTDILKDIQEITINSHLSGNIKDLKWSLKSNFSNILVEGLRNALKGQIEAAKLRVEKLIQEKINEQKDKLFADYGDVKDLLDKAIKDRKLSAESLQNLANKQIDGYKNQFETIKKKHEEKLRKKVEAKKKEALEKIRREKEEALRKARAAKEEAERKAKEKAKSEVKKGLKGLLKKLPF